MVDARSHSIMDRRLPPFNSGADPIGDVHIAALHVPLRAPWAVVQEVVHKHVAGKAKAAATGLAPQLQHIWRHGPHAGPTQTVLPIIARDFFEAIHGEQMVVGPSQGGSRHLLTQQKIQTNTKQQNKTSPMSLRVCTPHTHNVMYQWKAAYEALSRDFTALAPTPWAAIPVHMHPNVRHHCQAATKSTTKRKTRTDPDRVHLL